MDDKEGSSSASLFRLPDSMRMLDRAIVRTSLVLENIFVGFKDKDVVTREELFPEESVFLVDDDFAEKLV